MMGKFVHLIQFVYTEYFFNLAEHQANIQIFAYTVEPPIADPPITDPPITDPPITDPPTSGKPLYNGHWPWHQLKFIL